MVHAHGLARMRRLGLLAIGLGFALMAVGPAVSLTEIPAQLERERAMQELLDTPADHKGGGWSPGAYDDALRDTTLRVTSHGDFLILVGILLLVTGAWPARREPVPRRILRTTAAVVLVGIGMALLITLSRRFGDSPTSIVSAVDVAQLVVVGVAYACLAASRGSRLALGLGLAAAAVGALKLLLVMDQMEWHSGLAQYAYVTVPVLLWLGWTLTAAAFAAGAAPPDKPEETMCAQPLSILPTHAQ